MKERIFLFQTCIEKESQAHESGPNVTYPLGLAYLHSVLELEGYDILTKEYANTSEEYCLSQIEKIILDFKPKIVGISVLTMTRVSTYKAINKIKSIDKRIKIILGGVHASVMHRQLLENYDIDAVVIGEGELTIKELVPTLLKNKSLSKIRGIAYKNKKKIILNPPRELIHELDSLPFPKQELFMNPKRRLICMLSSRGCPSNCSFCCLQLFTKRRFRQRSVENIISEIKETLIKFPQIDTIEFSDDTFTLNEQRVIEFCKRILEEGIKLRFICSGRIKPASYKMFNAMQKAGFIEIRFGIESGSDKILKSIHKNITKEEILNTLKICSHFKKIRIVKLLMVGFPGETWDTVKETVEFVKEMQKIVKMDFFYATPLWVYPGTEIYSDMISKGQVSDDYWLTDKPVLNYVIEHPFEEIKAMSNYISFESAKSRGMLFLIRLISKKIVENPAYQLKRLLTQFIPSFFMKK